MTNIAIKEKIGNFVNYFLESFLFFIIITVVAQIFDYNTESPNITEKIIFIILGILVKLSVVFGLIFYFKKTMGNSKPHNTSVFLNVITVLVTILVMAVVLYGLSFMQPNIQETGSNAKLLQSTFKTISHDKLALSYYIVSLCIFSPIIEEIVCRGILLKKGYFVGKIGSMILSSIIFSLIHSPNNLYIFLNYFLTGLGLMIIRVKTDNVKYSILGHVIWNSCIMIYILYSTFGLKM
jgi:membrane protease YdiL (CAAX protease family)